jgi:hypothetical protein
MAGITLQQIKAIGNVGHRHRWNFILSSPPAVVPYDSEELNVRCISSGVPRLVGTTTEIKIRGIQVNQNGILAPEGPITLTFIETNNNMIQNFLKAWRDATWDQETSVSQPKTDLEAVIILQLLDQSNNARWQYEMKGCILESYDPMGGDLDGESTDGQRPAITIRYDWFKDGPIV